MSSESCAAALISRNDRVIKPRLGFQPQIDHQPFLARLEPRLEERRPPGRSSSADSNRRHGCQSPPAVPCPPNGFQDAAKNPWRLTGAAGLQKNQDVLTCSSLKIMESIFKAVSCDASGSSILTGRLEAPHKASHNYANERVSFD